MTPLLKNEISHSKKKNDRNFKKVIEKSDKC